MTPGVLLVTLGVPHPTRSGRQIRDFHVVRELARDARVHVVSILMEAEDTDTAPIRSIAALRTVVVSQTLLRTAGALLRRGIPFATRTFYSDEVARAIRDIATREGIDIVQLEHSFLACYRDVIPAACKAVLSFHNIGSVQYKRMAATGSFRDRAGMTIKAWLMADWEARLARRFDAVVVVSEVDGALLMAEGLAPTMLTVVENGVDVERLTALPPSAGAATLLFVGMMGYPPNADAVLEFCSTTLPLIQARVPRAELLVVGQAPTAAVRALDGQAGVHVTGSVAETTPYYRKACVAIVPLRAGGGTRLKILEAMALGRPVVSTTIGCEGLAVQHQRDLIIADTPAAFAEGVLSLLADAELAHRLAAQGRQLAEDRYDWRVTVAPLRALHRRLVS